MDDDIVGVEKSVVEDVTVDCGIEEVDFRVLCFVEAAVVTVVGAVCVLDVGVAVLVVVIEVSPRLGVDVE